MHCQHSCGVSGGDLWYMTVDSVIDARGLWLHGRLCLMVACHAATGHLARSLKFVSLTYLLEFRVQSLKSRFS